MATDVTDDYELTDYELGFLRGVFAARNIVEPTRKDMRDAAALMLLQSADADRELH